MSPRVAARVAAGGVLVGVALVAVIVSWIVRGARAVFEV